MLSKLFWLLTAAAMILPISDGHAARRALVIGVDRYDNLQPAQQLMRSVTDARGVSAVLRQVGFEVSSAENSSRSDFNSVWVKFLDTIASGDEVIFYYSGHGVEIDGLNYLIPRDAPSISIGRTERLRRDSLSVDELLRDLRERRAQVSFVILDAGRENPFAIQGLRAIGTRGGLARLDVPEGLFVLFSSGAGELALDRLSADDVNPHSVFVRHLIPLLKKPGLDLPELARQVRQDVSKLAATASHVQRPAYYDGIVGKFCVAGCPEPVIIHGPVIAAPAPTLKRIALVIGISNYKHAGRLANPLNDSALIAGTLKNLHFSEVVERQDLSLSQMVSELRDFGDRAAQADWAVVYFAGHGIELNGNAYLVPADAALARDTHVPDEAHPLDRVLEKVERARVLRLVIVDACRNNPFSARMIRSSGLKRGNDNGLPQIEPTGDVLIAYASKHGTVAEDGTGKNSPFVEAMAKHMLTPDLDIRLMFGRIRDDVRKATNNRQVPYIYGSMGGETYFFNVAAR